MRQSAPGSTEGLVIQEVMDHRNSKGPMKLVSITVNAHFSRYRCVYVSEVTDIYVLCLV